MFCHAQRSRSPHHWRIPQAFRLDRLGLRVLVTLDDADTVELILPKSAPHDEPASGIYGRFGTRARRRDAVIGAITLFRNDLKLCKWRRSRRRMMRSGHHRRSAPPVFYLPRPEAERRSDAGNLRAIGPRSG